MVEMIFEVLDDFQQAKLLIKKMRDQMRNTGAKSVMLIQKTVFWINITFYVSRTIFDNARNNYSAYQSNCHMF